MKSGAQDNKPDWPGRAWSRSMRALGVAMLATSALAVHAATASALAVHLENGKTLSYQPLRGAAGALGGPRPFDAFFSNLDYNGGPVMASNTNYAIYWRPSTGPAYPSDYQAGVNQYLTDLAHDSGGHENVDSVSAQYNDFAGEFASYNSHFGGALVDTDPYPANGCKQAPICLTDEQLRAELMKFVKANGLPTDLAHEYFLLTPKGVEDCFEALGGICSAGSKKPYYCAYHGNIPVGGSGELIYSNDPYVTGINGCDEGNHPNGSTSDGVLQGGLSHEHNESITDPEPNNAWTDFATGEATGYENGDKCGGSQGAALGTASNGAKYNQVINGHFYWYQEEWSNQGHQCLQRLTLSGAEPTATFTSRSKAGNEASFDATGSTAPGGVAHYNWQFNDPPGVNAPVETVAPTIAHTFSTKGRYLVALTVYAADGTSIGTERTIEVGGSPTVVTEPASAITQTAATVNATVNPNGGVVTECKFEYGTTTSYGSSGTCTPSPGSGSSPVAVSAALTGLAAKTTYHFRISATNPGGTSKGSDQTLTTPPNAPTALTGGATAVTPAAATLNATVNPNSGTVGDCHFEYGPTEAYGSSVTCIPAPGSGSTAVPVAASLGGLTANTTYHFRISAANAGGISTGSDQTFATPLAPHWYRSGTLLAEGEKVPTVSWGTLTLTAEPVVAPPTTCEDAAGGYVENPEGGGSGAGQTRQFASWNCTNAGCPPGKVKIGEAEYEREFTLTSGALPWSSVLTEEEPGRIRSESAGLDMILECVAHGSKKASEGPGANEPIELAPPTACVTTPTARLAPREENGPNATITSRLTFDKGAGALSCAGGGFKVRISGKLKTIGFQESEVVSAKTP